MFFLIMSFGYLIYAFSSGDLLGHIAAGIWMLVAIFAGGFSIRR